MYNIKLPSIYELNPPNFSILQLPPIRLDHNATESRFQCTYCLKIFKLKNSLKRHMRNHIKIKQYECLTCNKSFVRKDVLVSHQNTITCISTRLSVSNNLIMQEKIRVQEAIRSELLYNRIC